VNEIMNVYFGYNVAVSAYWNIHWWHRDRILWYIWYWLVICVSV